VRLDALLRELQLVSAGRVDSATAPRVGKLVGARRLVIGALTPGAGGELVIQARIADVATGDLRLAVSARAPLDQILDAEKALAFQVFDHLGVTLAPAERAAVEQRPTRSIAALLAYGRAVRYEAERQFDFAIREYQRAVDLDASFGLARERLADVRERAGIVQQTSAGVLRRRGQVARATGLAVDRVNRVLAVTGATQGNPGPADPSFPTEVVTVLITITTQP
jgi:hypothetical protein